MPENDYIQQIPVQRESTSVVKPLLDTGQRRIHVKENKQADTIAKEILQEAAQKQRQQMGGRWAIEDLPLQPEHPELWLIPAAAEVKTAGLIPGMARFAAGTIASNELGRESANLGQKIDERLGTKFFNPAFTFIGGLGGYAFGSGMAGNMLSRIPRKYSYGPVNERTYIAEDQTPIYNPRQIGSRSRNTKYTAPEVKEISLSPRQAFASETPEYLESLPIDKNRYYRYFGTDALDSYRSLGKITQMNANGAKAGRYNVPMFSKGFLGGGEDALTDPSLAWAISKPGAQLEWPAVKGVAVSPTVNGEFNQAPTNMFDFYRYSPGRGFIKLDENLNLPEGVTISETPYIDYLKSLDEKGKEQFLLQNGFSKDWLWTLENNPRHLENALQSRKVELPSISPIKYGYASPNDTGGNLELIDNFIENDIFPRLQAAGHNVTYEGTTKPVLRTYDPNNIMDQFFENSADAYFDPITNSVTLRGLPEKQNYGLMLHEIGGHGIRYNIHPDYRPMTPQAFERFLQTCRQLGINPKGQHIQGLNYADQLYTDVEKTLLDTAYEKWFDDGPGMGNRHEYGGVNTQLRAKISEQSGNRVGKELDPYIDNYSNARLLAMLREQPYTKKGTLNILENITGLDAEDLQFMSEVELNNIVRKYPEINTLLKRIKDTMKYVAAAAPIGIGAATISKQKNGGRFKNILKRK